MAIGRHKYESQVRNEDIEVHRNKFLTGNNGGGSPKTMVEVRRNARTLNTQRKRAIRQEGCCPNPMKRD